MAGLAITALAVMLSAGLTVPALRRGGGIHLASTPLAWAVTLYTLMYASGSGLGGMARSPLHAELQDVQPETPLWLLAAGISIELVMQLSIVGLVPTAAGRAGLRELGLRALPLERVALEAPRSRG